MVAQKAFRNIKSQLKDGQAQNALNSVVRLQKDSTLNTEPRLYDFGTQAYIALNDALNEKIYLKQSFDTLQFFNTIYGVYEYALKCDSLETIAKVTKGKSPKYKKQNQERIYKYYKNLNAGGRYFYAHGKYAEAIRFLTMALELPGWPIASNRIRPKSEIFVENAVILVRSAFELGDSLLIRQYAPLALQSTSEARCEVLEILARMAEASGDVPAYLKFLRQGLEEYPGDSYFFTSLSDYYTSQEDFQTSLSLADEMLRVDSANYYFLLAKGLSLMNLGRNDDALAFLERALAADSASVDVYYYIGAAYCNLATSVELPVNIRSKAYGTAKKEQRNFYEKACVFLERYRAMRPNEKKRWVPLLYQIYLALNEGEKFDEIEKITFEP